jgi:hypothetical protein
MRELQLEVQCRVKNQENGNTMEYNEVQPREVSS